MWGSHKGHPGVIETIRDHKGSVNGMATSTVQNICQIGACKLGNNDVSYAVLMVKIEVHGNIPKTLKF